jgi:hypothetical protein
LMKTSSKLNPSFQLRSMLVMMFVGERTSGQLRTFDVIEPSTGKEHCIFVNTLD